MPYNKAIGKITVPSEAEKDQESLLGNPQLSPRFKIFGSNWGHRQNKYIEGDVSKQSRSVRICKIIGNALIIILAICGLYATVRAAYQSYRDHARIREALCECKGSTPEDSIANGCEFDGLAMIWLPPQCRHDEITAEFEKMGTNPDGSWSYYDDPELTIEVPREDVIIRAWERKPGTAIYMETRWHITHCIYSWRREHQSHIDGRLLDPSAQGVGHIKHCGMKILDPALRSKVVW